MRISNVQVYGMSESIIASGYPMSTNIDSNREPTEKDENRAIKLGNCKPGTGHDNMLKGIIVQYDLTAPEYFWRQFDRYHFHDYVSSQSKMHCILKFDIDKMFNEYVDYRIINVLKYYISGYNKYPTPRNFQYVMSNVPMGLELTARITSNYLQEKSIYHQRKNHKLEEWQYYREWLETLPNFTELIGA